jgi:hypothetical protein
VGDDLDRLRALAGIKRDADPEEVIVLLPELPIEQMRDLLERLKEIAGEPDANWTEIEIGGVKYRATGVRRDW